MAKSARASRIKKNNQALKNKVFGPVEMARNERLSAKLLELASQPRPPRKEMQVDSGIKEAAETDTSRATEADDEQENEMDVNLETDADMETGSAAIRRAPRSGNALKKRRVAKLAHIQSKRRRKEKNLLVFTNSAQKAARERRKRQCRR